MAANRGAPRVRVRKRTGAVLELAVSWGAAPPPVNVVAFFLEALSQAREHRRTQLFSEWDKDGGGELGYNELRKILQAPRTPSSPAAKLAEAGAEMKVGAKLLGKLKKK